MCNLITFRDTTYVCSISNGVMYFSSHSSDLATIDDYTKSLNVAHIIIILALQ